MLFRSTSAGALLVAGGMTQTIGTSTGQYLVLNGNDSFSAGSGGNSSLIINGGGRTTYGFEFYCNGERLNAFDGEGEAYKPGGGSWADISDSRIKQNVADYTAGLDEIVQLQPVTYNFIPETGRNPDITYHGLIAQDVEEIMPELVITGRSTPWGRLQMQGSAGIGDWEDLRVVDPSPLVYALINAVKELAERVTALEPPPE